MRKIQKLHQFAKSRPDQDLILARIVKTQGSTYQKRGATKLIDTNGYSAGLLSGGCLEGEIVQKALKSLGQKVQASFSTESESDRFFGHALGCRGKITVEFETVRYREGFIEEVLGFRENEQYRVWLFGAGPDMDPLVELISVMGWELTVFEARTDVLEERLQLGWPMQKLDVRQIPSLPQNGRTAVLLMSHNYPQDLETLLHFCHSPFAFIGILGPNHRRESMLNDLVKVHGFPTESLDVDRIHGPVGLDGMGRGDESIALSVVSQLQQVFVSEDIWLERS